MMAGLERAMRSSGWRIALGALVVLVLIVGVGEQLGWPWLVAPLQRALSAKADRQVRFAEAGQPATPVRIRLIGGLRIEAGYVEIGAPDWSHAPYTLRARDATLVLAYADLWRARRGEPLVIRELRAATLDAQLERLADGRASWAFGKPVLPVVVSASPPRLPAFGRLEVAAGTLAIHDAPRQLDSEASFSLTDGNREGNREGNSDGNSEAAIPASAPSAVPGVAASAPPGFRLHATGTFRSFPMEIDISSPRVLATLASGSSRVVTSVDVQAVVGRAKLAFRGTTTDPINFDNLHGRFRVKGPSLAAVGDPVGVTLPTTGAFAMHGVIAKDAKTWNAVFEEATIGSSRLSGAFVYDTAGALPMLSGRLAGSRVMLADLGPAIGAGPAGEAASAPKIAPAAEAPADPAAHRGRRLPTRAFDLPALRAMNANVLVDFSDLDLGSRVLQPMHPLRTHLVLKDGVLELQDIDARTAGGRLGGSVQLDGREPIALWKADVDWRGVLLERWVTQPREKGGPPLVSGSLNGRAQVSGQGKSTASILGSMNGTIRMSLLDGAVSHLAVEAAGLDVAQAIGVWVKGDDALPVQCSVVDLVADHGELKPRLLVLDTADSTLWIDGSLSLASEALDLRVVVAPKDFSPLSLRTPVHLQGTFAAPKLSLEAGKVGVKLGAAGLLALLNPFAAIVPLIDTGDSAAAKRGDAACESLRERARSRLADRSPGSLKLSVKQAVH